MVATNFLVKIFKFLLNFVGMGRVGLSSGHGGWFGGGFDFNNFFSRGGGGI